MLETPDMKVTSVHVLVPVKRAKKWMLGRRKQRKKIKESTRFSNCCTRVIEQWTLGEIHLA